MGEREEERRPDSLAPIALEGAIDEEAAAMNRGKGRMLLAVAVVVAVCGGGTAYLMSGVDETRAYSEAGEALNGIKKKDFDRFWGCALEGVDLRNIGSDADLISQVRNRSSQGGIRYARHVNRQCLEVLDEVETNLSALSLPPDLQPQLTGMKEAIVELRKGWQSYVSYLTGNSRKFEEAEARPHLNQIGRGWHGFEKGHGELNRIIRERLL